MTHDRSAMTDQLEVAARYAREARGRVPILGYGAWTLEDEHGNVHDAGHFLNLVTQLGDQYYMDRAAGVAGAPALVTGMQLGTGTTAPSKTGAGAAIVTLVPASLVAINPTTPVSSLNGSARRLLYTAQWAAGVATANAISEVVLTNQSVGTQTAAPASATVARALLTPTVNKAASDILTVTWSHDAQGA